MQSKIYCRLLSGNEADRLIKFVNRQKNGDEAYFTEGAVALWIQPESLERIKEFLNGINAHYQFSYQDGTTVVAKIVKDLKDKGIIA